ncbi:MAG: zinc ribbon domain-containing protein [Chloroflexota bacterium]|nr:zinc ribbon domain-containing protein [Chloroflexota bacterium]
MSIEDFAGPIIALVIMAVIGIPIFIWFAVIRAAVSSGVRDAAGTPLVARDDVGESVFCVRCGRQNPADANYCMKCGAAIVR